MNTYFKSFVTIEHQPVTTIYNPEKDSRKTCQTLSQVLHQGVIEPNTVHSELEKRLCVSLMTNKYTGTYRPEGIVFATSVKPDYVVPFDMMTLTTGKTFTSSDFHSKFLRGYKKFVYDSIDSMLEENPDPKSTLTKLNEFRKSNGLEEIEKDTMNYNECCFNEKVQIVPIALIGSGPEYKKLSREHNIPLFNTYEEFSKQKNPSLYDFTEKSVIGAIYRVGASFAVDAATYLAVTGGSMNQFFERFQLDKFVAVTAAVVGINFLDYKFDITNKLHNAVRNGRKKILAAFDKHVYSKHATNL
jgi:hypothetical protein